MVPQVMYADRTSSTRSTAPNARPVGHHLPIDSRRSPSTTSKPQKDPPVPHGRDHGIHKVGDRGTADRRWLRLAPRAGTTDAALRSTFPSRAAAPPHVVAFAARWRSCVAERLWQQDSTSILLGADQSILRTYSWDSSVSGRHGDDLRRDHRGRARIDVPQKNAMDLTQMLREGTDLVKFAKAVPRCRERGGLPRRMGLCRADASRGARGRRDGGRGHCTRCPPHRRLHPAGDGGQHRRGEVTGRGHQGRTRELKARRAC